MPFKNYPSPPLLKLANNNGVSLLSDENYWHCIKFKFSSKTLELSDWLISIGLFAILFHNALGNLQIFQYEKQINIWLFSRDLNVLKTYYISIFFYYYLYISILEIQKKNHYSNLLLKHFSLEEKKVKIMSTDSTKNNKSPK